MRTGTQTSLFERGNIVGDLQACYEAAQTALNETDQRRLYVRMCGMGSRLGCTCMQDAFFGKHVSINGKTHSCKGGRPLAGSNVLPSAAELETTLLTEHPSDHAKCTGSYCQCYKQRSEDACLAAEQAAGDANGAFHMLKLGCPTDDLNLLNACYGASLEQWNGHFSVPLTTVVELVRCSQGKASDEQSCAAHLEEYTQGLAEGEERVAQVLTSIARSPTTSIIWRGVTIRGAGRTATTVLADDLDSNTALFQIAGGAGTGPVVFEDLTLRGENLSPTQYVTGLAIYDNGTGMDLHVSDVDVRDFTQSGIRVHGTFAALTRVSVFDNIADPNGGGVYVSNYSGQVGQLRLEKCSIHDNVAQSSGGGVYFAGGSNNQWDDSTISSNDATYGGGVYIDSPGIQGDYVQMNRLTIADNSAYAGGAFRIASSNEANVLIYGTIVGDNTATLSGGRDGWGTVSSADNSLFESYGWISFIATWDLILGQDPVLGSLQVWPGGYPTAVHPLGQSSPARNVVSQSANEDQRGFDRCVGGGATPCDIGAFEYQ